MARFKILLFTALILTISAGCYARTEMINPAIEATEACYAKLENNILAIGNDQIQRQFEFNNGELKSISLQDLATGTELITKHRRPDIRIGKLTGKPISADWEKSIVEDSVTPPHLQVEVITVYEKIDLKRIFRIYPNCSVIGCDYYVKAKSDDIPGFSSAETTLQMLRPQGKHWNYRAVEFFDQTDGINTLVRQTNTLAFSSGTQLRGNLLFAQNPLSDAAFFMVKEAPCSFVQLNYPDNDFNVSTNSVSVSGMGITQADLIVNDWVRVYGLAVGVCKNSETDFLKSLRRYQKNLRKNTPERDEMIMMNTWGDRNRDARLGEEFAKKEIDACSRLGITHLQLDDGWQSGLSMNSAAKGKGGRLWDLWDAQSWKPHPKRFPNGLKPVVEYAKKKGVRLGLWFHPSNANDYEHWLRDAKIVVDMYKQHGICNIKIDGIKLPTKKADINLRNFFEYISKHTNGQVVINLDATADNRTGYHYCTEYGNLFLENRYSDWTKYYPYWTLRNLWMLSKYVPAEKLQIEFLNIWRNAKKYGEDPLAPANLPFEYAFAVTMMGQPLAWFEGTGLPEQAFNIAPTIKAYRKHQADIHNGTILPIGQEPNGTTWTGFQSIISEKEGYLLVFREYNKQETAELKLYDLAGKKIKCKRICGQGKDTMINVDNKGNAAFKLPKAHNFALYHYNLN